MKEKIENILENIFIATMAIATFVLAGGIAYILANAFSIFHKHSLI